MNLIFDYCYDLITKIYFPFASTSIFKSNANNAYCCYWIEAEGLSQLIGFDVAFDNALV